MERLRFATVGSVDDGKSTLIGRLLYDSKSIFEDQLEHIEAVSKRRGDDYVDLSLLTDGLRAEREQGITIDVAHIYFSTAEKSYIIADTPGHVEYTRNMITGASTSQAAIILIDARKGVLTQTKRHSYLVKLMGIKHVVLAINKMDKDGADPERVTNELAAKDVIPEEWGGDTQFIKVSAHTGDGIDQLLEAVLLQSELLELTALIFFKIDRKAAKVAKERGEEELEVIR